MKFTKEQKEDIYVKYMRVIDRISEDLEDKTQFSAKEIIYILLNIIETENYDSRKI